MPEDRRQLQRETDQKIHDLVDEFRTFRDEDGKWKERIEYCIYGEKTNGDEKPGIFERVRLLESRYRTMVWLGGVMIIALIGNIVKMVFFK